MHELRASAATVLGLLVSIILLTECSRVHNCGVQFLKKNMDIH